MPSLPISSAPPSPCAHRRAVKPPPSVCVCPPLTALRLPCVLRPSARVCAPVRQLCPASAVARACALDELTDIGKRLHSASRTAAKTYNRRSTRRRSPRPRPAVGDDYTITCGQACRNVSHPANLVARARGADRSDKKSPGERLPVGVLSWCPIVSSVRSCWRRETVALHALICRLPEVSR